MFGIKLDKSIELDEVKIIQQFDNLLFSIDDKFFLRDDISYINDYCYKIHEIDYTSVLIGGLGLGIIPFYMENFTSTSDIDVVEINTKVMSVTRSLGHLKSTNIIYDNFIKYNTTKKYDLIIADLWWIKSENFDEEKAKIVTNFWQNLNEGGRIYFPIINQFF